MQPDADMITDPSRASRPHPTPVPLNMLPLPAADSHAHTAADSLPGSAIDVEAQDGSCLVSRAMNGTAEMTAAGCDPWPRNDGNDSENGGEEEEPADVAAERVKADRLWAAARNVPSGESASRGGHRRESACGGGHNGGITSRCGHHRESASRSVASEETTDRGGLSGGSASPAGPAILLHNLRKVCKAAHS